MNRIAISFYLSERIRASGIRKQTACGGFDRTTRSTKRPYSTETKPFT